MEQTVVMKAVALFATLMGIYQWLGQGTSLFDILVILFATALIVSIDLDQKREITVPIEAGDNSKENSLFVKRALPLREILTQGLTRAFFVKKIELQTLY